MASEAVEAPEDGDRLLLERLRAGEDEAFGELFSRHSAAVFRLALGLAGDRAEADDLTAEAFFRVLQAIRRGSGPVDNVRGYLLIVARRVACEWSLRRRDVPVSDEELTHRAPSDPDTAGQFTERNLIRRAFTSLPERWRRVLWKMEVEGERPAAVATNFGLSPNATAALARRARQGLRAAYLQAHLAEECGASGCRSILDKLGAYTAGTTSGIERRRIRTHLSTCSSCTAMYAELRDVFVGLRPHSGLMTAPVVALAGWQALKSLFASTKVQISVAATSVAAVGVLGLVLAPQGGSAKEGLDLAGKRAIEMHVAPREAPPSTAIELPGASLDSSIVPPKTEAGDREYKAQDVPPEGTTSQEVPPPRTPADDVPASTSDDARSDAPMSSDTEQFDENAPIVYRETTVETYREQYPEYTLVHETTTVTEVNSLDQTRTLTETTTYKEANAPPSRPEQPAASSPPTFPEEPAPTT